MAREYAQIKLAIWADDDWRDLSPLARYLYLTLLTSATLSHCGVADWRPSRISALNGMSVEEINHSGAELVEAFYLVVDEDSEEVLIRSFIRNDGLMKQPRMAVSMATAHAAVASKGIRAVIVHELKRLREDFPDLAGWSKEKATHLLSLASVSPSTYPCGKGPFGGPFTPGLAQAEGSVWGSTKGSPTPAPTPTPSNLSPSQNDAPADAGREMERFDEFWTTYDKPVGKKAAAAKYRIALKKPGVTAELLIASARSYIAAQKAQGKHREYTKDPARWLNGEHWADERTNVHPLRASTDDRGQVVLPPLPKGVFEQ